MTPEKVLEIAEILSEGRRLYEAESAKAYCDAWDAIRAWGGTHCVELLMEIERLKKSEANWRKDAIRRQERLLDLEARK